MHALRYCRLARRCNATLDAGHGILRQSGIVTGGSRGIGLAIARALVAEGVQVAITGRERRASVDGAPTDRRRRDRARVETLQADVRRYDEVQRAIDATVARFGGLDFLVNNAGVGIFADVADDDARAVGARSSTRT